MSVKDVSVMDMPLNATLILKLSLNVRVKTLVENILVGVCVYNVEIILMVSTAKSAYQVCNNKYTSQF